MRFGEQKLLLKALKSLCSLYSPETIQKNLSASVLKNYPNKKAIVSTPSA
jgi:hypothetical protein